MKANMNWIAGRVTPRAPKQLCSRSPSPRPSPPGRGRIARRLTRRPATGLTEPRWHCLNWTTAVPSPGGEGQDEGGRHSFICRRRREEALTWASLNFLHPKGCGLINTWLQPGVVAVEVKERFQPFPPHHTQTGQAVETARPRLSPHTGLKPGANEMRWFKNLRYAPLTTIPYFKMSLLTSSPTNSTKPN